MLKKNKVGDIGAPAKPKAGGKNPTHVNVQGQKTPSHSHIQIQVSHISDTGSPDNTQGNKPNQAQNSVQGEITGEEMDNSVKSVNPDDFPNPDLHINPELLTNYPDESSDLTALNNPDEPIPPEGLVNPVFSIDTASETSKQNTPEKVASVFNFSECDVKQYTRQAAPRSPKHFLSPPGKAKKSSTSSGLTIPDVTSSRRPSDPLTFVQDDHFSQLQPLTTSNGLSRSEGRLQPLSPGYLTPCPYNSRFPPPRSPGLLSTNSAWSELAKLSSRRSSYGDFNDEGSNSNSVSNVSSSLSEHLHQLVRAFSSRTERIKECTIQPPTPSSIDEYHSTSDANSVISAQDEPEQRQHRLDSFIPIHLRERGPLGGGDKETLDSYFLDCGCCKPRVPSWLKNPFSIPKTLEPHSKLYMCWLFLVAICFMYNAWAIPLRATFPYQNASNLIYWMICDYTCDAIYMLDILVVKPHLTFLNSGLVETDPKLTRKNYMQKRMFRFDMLSMLPLDLFYLVWGVVPWWRLPRLLKIQTFWEFYQRCDQAVKSAHILRIMKTMTYMLFLIHLETCGYYAMSVYEGIGSNRWVYNGEGIAYIRCFYLATKTATSIGNNPIPTNTIEYVFMTIYWVSGVFVFALLIGQIRDIVDAAGKVKAQYDKMMYDALRYVKNLNCPYETQLKVRTWFLYQWQQQKISDERKLMDWLPKNLRTDLAIHVHFNTLSKVTLFQDCDKSLLFDLVLKLKPILFLPGEYVCRKGEVGKEMYIVSQGQVEVVGGPDNVTVLATLKEGSVFGEISLLAIAEDGNRRTADVRCKGFTNLFILSLAEFEDAMAEYPEAHTLLRKRAKRLLRQNAKLSSKSPGSTESSKVDVEPIIQTSSRESNTPKLFTTVLQKWEQTWQVIDPDSSVAKYLTSHKDSIQDGHNDSLQQDGHRDSLQHGGHRDSLQKGAHRDSLQKGGQKDSLQHGDLIELKEQDGVTNKPLPDPEEAEDFYSKMLDAELMHQETYEAMTSEAEKKQLRRHDTNNTEQSEASTDSGVQMPRVMSPPESISKTTSNKDGKELLVDCELNKHFEQTCNWVITQALKAPEVEKTRRHSRVEDESRVKMIVDVLTKQNPGVCRRDEVELMSAFFEDELPTDLIQDQVADGNDRKSNVQKLDSGQDRKVSGGDQKKESDQNRKVSGSSQKKESGQNEKVSGSIQKKESVQHEIMSSGVQKNHVGQQKKISSSNQKSESCQNGKVLSSVPKCDNRQDRKSLVDKTEAVVVPSESYVVVILPSGVENESHQSTIPERTTAVSADMSKSGRKDDNDEVFEDSSKASVVTEIVGGDKPTSEILWKKSRLSSSSITMISGEYDQNNELLLNSFNSDIDQHNLAREQGQRSLADQSNNQDIHVNGIPLQNQITCSVEVHREKSLTPASLKGLLDSTSSKPRSTSVNSITKEITLRESSV